MTVQKPQIYELLNKPNGVSYSPWVIQTILFFKHKGIDYDLISLTFKEVGPTIKELTNGEWDLVPTIKFPNGDIVFDSEKIAQYLDEKYPESPLIASDTKVNTLFNRFFDEEMGYCTYELILLDVYHSLDASSQKVYRVSKELEVGTTLEEFSSNPEQNIKQFHEASKTLDELLTNSNYLQGDSPGFFDYRIFGVLQCIRSIKKEHYNALVIKNPYVKVSEWAEKMDNLFDGYLKNRKTL
ncbi:hypothetical protein CONCODRAFT_8738 [Conidiobolus coronatus NRRL 28638]|uniref:Uncharacterized protein n=1 Tax=Conidiobolus coronatus (strain ATCC 28846 / CBS 209.66 / NRRL 28638) TaxID=796925 RepID=A0A137P1L3_CONC2|nr:hypothetical protein CONCODRAFT_8738 [Conidiobolus coronatus NRRL 28638]|eukprot:KXN68933.1 hypothetical protein CONCODRAFT_8738 [Conidiobolus coronatus NRRL 28638]